MTPSTLHHPLDKQFQHLSIRYHDNIPFVTVLELNRPQKRNAINTQMWREIGDAFRQLGTTGDGCRCILLIGSGKGFCGGIDLSDTRSFAGMDGTITYAEGDDSSRCSARQSLAFRSQILEMQSAFTAVENCPVPVVAAIHGACIGAGVDLVCCADIRVSSPDALFSVREVRLGLAADVGTLQRFPKIVGFGSRVRELCLSGDDFDAMEALHIGFVSRVSRTNCDLMNVANEICHKICRNSPVASTVTKMSLNYSRDHTVAEGLEHIALHNSTALMTEDLAKSFMNAGGVDGAIFSPLLTHSRL